MYPQSLEINKNYLVTICTVKSKVKRNKTN